MRPAPETFIRAHCRPQPVPLAPGLQLWLAHELDPLWRASEAWLAEQGVTPPFWAFAWAGGQALARYVLDRPAWLAGRAVLDWGAGSGLVGLAALKAGAASVLAVDPDPLAGAAVVLNAALNGLPAPLWQKVAPAVPPSLILAGDIFYDRTMTDAVWPQLCAWARQGAEVLIGDPARAYRPSTGLVTLARYDVPVSRAVEGAATMPVTVDRVVPA